MTDSYEPVQPQPAEPGVPQYPSPPTYPPPAAPTPGSLAPAAQESARRRFGWLGVLIAAVLGGCIGAAVIGAAGLALYLPTRVSSTGAAVEETQSASPVTIAVGDTEATFAEAVAKKVTPSVVNVAVEQQVRDFWTGSVSTEVAGNGSGVIIRADGYILTNYHVIEGASGLIVTIGTEDLPATVVGTDPSSDLAVIRVSQTGLPAMEIGSSADLVVGSPVVAIGSPFGLEKTVTTGIISALGRSSMASGSSGLTTYTSLIQTDAAINPGNSGGALTDAAGLLIGINTLIQTTSGSSAGIGFAIPVDFAMQIAEELIATGRASHPFMGVGTATIDPNYANQYGLPVTSGALVQSVTTGSPAEAAGMKRGDVIVAIGDAAIKSVEDVFAAVRSHKVGETIDVEVVRGEERLTLEVTLGSDASAR
jgi:putative serine protease PepD